MKWLKNLLSKYYEVQLVKVRAVYEKRMELHGSAAYIYTDVLAKLHSEICVLQWKMDMLKDKP